MHQAVAFGRRPDAVFYFRKTPRRAAYACGGMVWSFGGEDGSMSIRLSSPVTLCSAFSSISIVPSAKNTGTITGFSIIFMWSCLLSQYHFYPIFFLFIISPFSEKRKGNVQNVRIL
jgi:hypothetical protein